jgi:N-methylhydantoinase B
MVELRAHEGSVPVKSQQYDVIGAEVHRKAMENLTNEMTIAMLRTSGSPVVVEAKDFSACFMDTVPEHLGFAAYVMTHIGSSLAGTRAIAQGPDAGDLRPGDGWVVNDPYEGGALHQGDLGVIMPTFYEDHHLGWGFVNMHMLDVGGSGVSGYAPGAHDVFEEGVRLPPLRIIREGRIDPAWERMIAANVRTPGPVINDIRSMIAGCNVASGKLQEIVRRFGVEGHLEFCEINKDLSERVARDRIARIPDGVYETVDWAEFDGHEGPDRLLEMKLRLVVDGEDLRFTFSSPPQIDAFINSTFGPMYGHVVSAILPMLFYGDLPLNGGALRPISLDIGEPGTLLNALPPAPVSNAHSEASLRTARMVQRVLCQALVESDDPVLRGRVKGESQDAFPGVSMYGTNQHGGTSVLFYADNIVGPGGGAQTVFDGQDCYGCSSLIAGGIADVESHEAADPVLFLWRRIAPNSGGPGLFRGGQALEQAFSIYGTDLLTGPTFNSSAQIPPAGFGGGVAGATGDLYPVRASNVEALMRAGEMPLPGALDGTKERIRSKTTRIGLQEGDALVLTSGGGGGLGDPLLRAPESVIADIAAGYITTAHAEAAYGVVTTGDGAIDPAATADRRAALRRDRIGKEPAAELKAPREVGIAVERLDDGTWCCASCAAGFGTEWRDATVVREALVFDRFKELDMYVRERAETPARFQREHFCPQCAAALATELVLVETDTESASGPELGTMAATAAGSDIDV